MAQLLPHVLARLSDNWGSFVASTGTQVAAAAANGAPTTEASAAAESEVIAERQLHELTAEHFSLLAAIQDSCEPSFSWEPHDVSLATLPKHRWRSPWKLVCTSCQGEALTLKQGAMPGVGDSGCYLSYQDKGQ